MKSFKNASFLVWAVKTASSEYLDTLKKREKLIKILEKALKEAMELNDLKLIAFIAQTINSVLKSYDETRFNEDYAKLKELLRIAKERLKQTGAGAQGTPVT